MIDLSSDLKLARPASLTETPVAGSNDAELARRTILIVEDELLIAMDLKGRLEKLGYEVVDMAQSAEAALSLAAAYAPDVVLMDIRLQGNSDGIAAAAEVRRQLNIPVIFLTSHADAKTVDRARLSEPFGYIVKPFGSVNFRAIIEIALQNHANEGSLRESVNWHTALEKSRLLRLFNGYDSVDDDPATNSDHQKKQNPVRRLPVESIPGALIGVDQEGQIAWVTGRAARLFGYAQKALRGQHIQTVVPGHFKSVVCPLESDHAANRISPAENGPYFSCLKKDGSSFPAEISIGTMETSKGPLLLVLFHDVSARERDVEQHIRRLSEEKEIILNEIHHRVKNNLQIVSSLLRLEADQVDDPTVKRIFVDSENRIESMALLHQRLYTANNSARIDFGAYLRSLVNHLVTSYGKDAMPVNISVEASEVHLDLAESIPCGLIFNELISNSLKHSFREKRAGNIQVAFATASGRYVMTVSDDGTPLPDNMLAKGSSTMGMRLVEALTRQLRGELQMGFDPKFRITFPRSSGETAEVVAVGRG